MASTEDGRIFALLYEADNLEQLSATVSFLV
jgi:hypothetical protein